MLKRLFLILLLAPGTTLAAPVILVLGDSLSAGYGMDQSDGWVSLLDRRLERAGYRHEVVNISISGETTRGALARLDTAMKRHRPEIVIVELGANDGLRGLELETMERNLADIIERAQAGGAQVLLAGMRLPANYGPRYTREFHDIYLRLAERYDLQLVPFLLDGLTDSRAFFQPDGLHPTAQAQTLILQNVWPRLEPMLE